MTGGPVVGEVGKSAVYTSDLSYKSASLNGVSGGT